MFVFLSLNKKTLKESLTYIVSGPFLRPMLRVGMILLNGITIRLNNLTFLAPENVINFFTNISQYFCSAVKSAVYVITGYILHVLWQ